MTRQVFTGTVSMNKITHCQHVVLRGVTAEKFRVVKRFSLFWQLVSERALDFKGEKAQVIEYQGRSTSSFQTPKSACDSPASH